MQDNQHETDAVDGIEGGDASEPSIRDQIQEALTAASDSDEAAEQATDENTAQENDKTTGKGEPSADDSTNAGDDDEAEADKPTEEAASDEDTAYPKSWNAEAREMFRKLPQKAREYILRREREQEQGVQKLKQQYEAKSQFADEMWGAIAPYQQMIQAEGSDPVKAVQNLLNMAAVMRTGTPEQKRELLITTARQFGVDLNAGPGNPEGSAGSTMPDPAISTLHNELSALKQQLVAQQQAQLQAQQAEIMSEIEKFSADKPYFDDVQETMAKLLDAGIANDLNDAYERAIRLDDGVWQRIQADREKERAKKEGERVKKAKRASASISGAPGAAGGNGPAPKRDLREEIAAQFASHRA